MNWRWRKAVGAEPPQQLNVNVRILGKPMVKIGDTVFLDFIEQFEERPRTELVHAGYKPLAAHCGAHGPSPSRQRSSTGSFASVGPDARGAAGLRVTDRAWLRGRDCDGCGFVTVDFGAAWASNSRNVRCPSCVVSPGMSNIFAEPRRPTKYITPFFEVLSYNVTSSIKSLLTDP
jgi:hypothetical protein